MWQFFSCMVFNIHFEINKHIWNNLSKRWHVLFFFFFNVFFANHRYVSFDAWYVTTSHFLIIHCHFYLILGSWSGWVKAQKTLCVGSPGSLTTNTVENIVTFGKKYSRYIYYLETLSWTLICLFAAVWPQLICMQSECNMSCIVEMFIFEQIQGIQKSATLPFYFTKWAEGVMTGCLPLSGWVKQNRCSSLIYLTITAEYCHCASGTVTHTCFCSPQVCWKISLPRRRSTS